MSRSEHIKKSNETLQNMIVKVSQIRRYRIETGDEHPDIMRIWDKLNAQFHSLTEDDKTLFDEFLD